ncbi:hypothetical protein JD844_017725 [Phrynosoma platyrhinos]|uniref:Phosvitin n=1 Tax=Phrynosoma platyrhinos TaxID=52577 RepID=A0ABQ7SM83_PHRPL|nr:hypothetical protein JD844_017725 [Phrynosoma platyrhinos]
MKVLILAIVLTLVGCQQQVQQIKSNRNQIFSYDYEFEIRNRLPGKGFASAGIKVKCKVDIGQIDSDRKLVQAHSFEVFDYNGIYPWQRFIRSPKLTELFEREVKDVITFQHRNGHVEDIMAPAHISEFAFNIYKGILNLFEYTLKIDQKNYNLRENGIEGKCNTTYLLRSAEKNNEILVTKSKDLNDCDDMVLKVIGAAYATPCKFCKEIEEILQYLAGHPNEKFPADGTIKFLQLVQLLRTADETDYFDLFFKRYSSQPAYRRVILDLIPAVGNPVAIRFIRHKMEQGELTSFEISQTLLMFFHFCNVSQEVVEEAMIIVIEVLKDPDSAYRRLITLGYGSLLNRYCSASSVCPDKYLKPLADFATKAAQSSDIEGINLAIKTYGNVGHQAILKPIMKFMPNSASSYDLRTQCNALMALRNLGKKDPVRVQGLAFQVILNYKIDAVARVFAAMVLLETKPTLPVLMILANAMLNEPSMQVENFVYTHLRAMATSTNPDLQVIISYGWLHMAFHANNGVGIGSGRMHDVLEKAFASGRDANPFTDPEGLLSKFSDQKTSHASNILLGGGYLKMFDQDIMTGVLKADMISGILQAYQRGTKSPLLKEVVDILKNQNTLQWDKNCMTAEIHRVVPTCTGLPLQISLVHISNTKLVGNAQLSITPEPTSHFTLLDMMKSNIKLKTKLSLSIYKDMFMTMGVITPEIQAVLEENAKLIVNVPLNIDATLNIKENNFKVELPPCKQETDIISLRFKTSAVTCNIEEAPASKSTPVLLPETMSNIMKQSFDSSSAEQERTKDEPSSEIRSTEKIYSQKQSERHLDSVRHTMCFKACTFGCKACIESSNAYAGCILGDSLYNIVGEHVLKLTLKQDDTRAPIEKLQFTIQGGAHAAAEKVQLLRNEEKEIRIRRIEERTSSSEESDSSSESLSRRPRDVEKYMNEDEDEQQEPDQRRYHNQEQSSEKRKKPLFHQFSGSSSSSQQQQQETSSDSNERSSRRSSSTNMVSSSSESSPQESEGRESSSDSRSNQHAKRRYQRYQDRKRDKTQSSKRMRPSDESEHLKTENHEDELLPYFTLVAQALRSDNKDQGYKLSMYMNHEIYKIHSKMVATELAKTKWRACFDSQMLPYRFQSYMSWGNECRDYRIEMKVSRGHVARHAALQMNMKWTKLPTFFKEHASRALEFLPGIAYISGFSAVYQKNPSRELMLRMIASSPYTTAMILKIPGETFYKDGLCYPFTFPVLPAAYYQPPQITTFNILDLASWLAQGDQAVCEVGEERIVTFDDKIFNTTLINQDCDLLVVQDCNKNYKPKFRLWTRKPNPKLPREIHLNLTTAYIKILPSLDAIIVLCNDKPILVDKLLHEDLAAKIKIYRNNTTVVIEAPEYGLVNVTYNRVLLRVTVATRMKGNTCGVCGDNNGEKRNEGLMPNQELALNDIDFFHSWSSADKCVTENAPTSPEFEKAAAA